MPSACVPIHQIILHSLSWASWPQREIKSWVTPSKGCNSLTSQTSPTRLQGSSLPLWDLKSAQCTPCLAKSNQWPKARRHFFGFVASSAVRRNQFLFTVALLGALLPRWLPLVLRHNSDLPPQRINKLSQPHPPPPSPDSPLPTTGPPNYWYSRTISNTITRNPQILNF